MEAGPPVVEFNAYRTRARVQLIDMFGQLAGGGYDLELAKLDGDWFVASIEQVFIS
jgi:hypothetical protein